MVKIKQVGIVINIKYRKKHSDKLIHKNKAAMPCFFFLSTIFITDKKLKKKIVLEILLPLQNKAKMDSDGSFKLQSNKNYN